MNKKSNSKTKGPYFQGQQTSANCGCYYPDVSRTPSGGLYCFEHGWIRGPINEDEKPTEAWRNIELKRLEEEG